MAKLSLEQSKPKATLKRESVSKPSVVEPSVGQVKTEKQTLLKGQPEGKKGVIKPTLEQKLDSSQPIIHANF